MKKKLAILVGGMFREFENAHKSWSFLNYESNDVFFSTWDKTQEINQKLEIDIEEDVTEERIKKYLPNAYIQINKDTIEDLSTVSSIKKIIFHWKILIKMVEESGNQYDTIILTRPDLYIREKVDLNKFIENIVDGRVYGLTPVEQRPYYPFFYVQDCLFFSKFNVIEKMINKLEINPEADDIHGYLSCYFINNRIFVDHLHPVFVDYFVLRSVHRDVMHLDYENLRLIGLDWWSIKNRNKDPMILIDKLNYMKNE